MELGHKPKVHTGGYLYLSPDEKYTNRHPNGNAGGPDCRSEGGASSEGIRDRVQENDPRERKPKTT